MTEGPRVNFVMREAMNLLTQRYFIYLTIPTESTDAPSLRSISTISRYPFLLPRSGVSCRTERKGQKDRVVCHKCLHACKCYFYTTLSQMNYFNMHFL